MCKEYLETVEILLEKAQKVSSSAIQDFRMPIETYYKPTRSIETFENILDPKYNNAISYFPNKNCYIQSFSDMFYQKLENLWIFKEKPYYQYECSYGFSVNDDLASS